MVEAARFATKFLSNSIVGLSIILLAMFLLSSPASARGEAGDCVELKVYEDPPHFKNNCSYSVKVWFCYFAAWGRLVHDGCTNDRLHLKVGRCGDGYCGEVFDNRFAYLHGGALVHLWWGGSTGREAAQLGPNGKFYLGFVKGKNAGRSCRFDEAINMNVCKSYISRDEYGEINILRRGNERSPDVLRATWQACRKVTRTLKLMLTPWGPTLSEETRREWPTQVIAWKRKKKEEVTWQSQDRDGNWYFYRRYVTTFSKATCNLPGDEEWIKYPSIGDRDRDPNLSLAEPTDPPHPDLPVIHGR